MIQEHKWRFLNDFITRGGRPLKLFMDIVVSMDVQIRESYSESIDGFSKNELAKMMVLDGVFLIELFRKVGRLSPVHQDDPIFKMIWVSPLLMMDILKIENQIPFFVLQKLYDESRTDERTLPSLIFEFYNYLVDRQPKILKKCENLEGKHLLDLFRKSFINTNNNGDSIRRCENAPLKLIQPATALAIKGVKFRANHQAESFLDIEFENGILYIPQINMDDFYSSFFLNCVAFEQCYFHCSKDITTYVVFMGCLMNTSTDASVLSGSKIIENYFTDSETAEFFFHIGKDVAFDIKNNYLQGLFKEVNDYCKNGWHVGWAGFIHKFYFENWPVLSALAAFMLLSLAALQTFYTVYPYYRKDK
uniref:UPF0481 protein At3g47200-like n=1 Tax=Erigeron canadensis TaxID=72917 RepID=UPI001CB8E204|nr:UPF0481 protein At3g47200-like [Erigeron canadensis]